MLSLLFATATSSPQTKLSNWRAEDRASLRASHYRPRKIWSIRAPSQQCWLASSQNHPILVESPNIWKVLSRANGKTLLRFDHCRDVKVFNGYALALIGEDGVNTTCIQAWNLKTRKLVWTVLTGKRAVLGGTLGGVLFYYDNFGTHRTAVPSGKELQTIQEGAVEMLVTPNRIYLDQIHWCLGLLPTDLNRGWKDYLDASPSLEYDGVLYGVGSVANTITAVRMDGKVLSFKGLPYFAFWHDKPIVTKSRVVLGGVASGNSYIGEFLFGFDRKSLKLVWKKPMMASNTTGYSDKVVVYAGRRTGQTDSTYQFGLEIRSVQTGSLFWRDTHKATFGDLQLNMLVGLGDRFLIHRDGKITAYR